MRLIDADAVIERLNKVCLTDDYLFMALKQGIDHAIAVINEAPTFTDVPDNNVGKWIPVSERLPENEVRVLVMLKAGTSNYTNMDTDRTYKSGVWVRWGNDVTHWMPLPEPPKEGEANGT